MNPSHTHAYTQDLDLLKFQKIQALRKLEEKTMELREARRENDVLRQKQRDQELAIAATSRAWDELDDVLRAVISRMTFNASDDFYPTEVPAQYRQTFMERLLQRVTPQRPAAPGVAPEAAEKEVIDGINAAVEARSKNTQVVLSNVLEMLWKNRFAYTKVAQLVRDAASNPAGSAPAPAPAAQQGGTDATSMLALDNEKLHKVLSFFFPSPSLHADNTSPGDGTGPEGSG